MRIKKKRFIYLIWMDTPYWLKRQPTFHLNRCNTKNGTEKNVTFRLGWFDTHQPHFPNVNFSFVSLHSKANIIHKILLLVQFFSFITPCACSVQNDSFCRSRLNIMKYRIKKERKYHSIVWMFKMYYKKIHQTKCSVIVLQFYENMRAADER